jgi:cell volume regulation protein A
LSDSELILVGGALLAVGIGAALIADRVRVPGLLLFLALGMLVGSEGVGGVEFDDAELTRTLGTIGLVLILFEGGLSAGWREIRPVIGTAISLAIVGTLLTSIAAGAAAVWLLDLGWLEGLIVGAAVAATDSAAIFAVLRGSQLRRRLARSLEGESGMNDPVALLLVTGFISWIQEPGYGIADMALSLVAELGIGAALGILIGFAARWAFLHLDLPTPGLFPVASIAAAGLSYGLTEELHGSGFLAVYVAALVLGTGALPARRTITAFHQGVAWVAQIALFFMLGLLVFPSQLIDVALEGLLLSATLMLVARPLAAGIASLVSPYGLAERLMLGWAGLRGAIPIWLATFPVIAGIEGSEELFNLIFFVVVTSTLIQGATFEPLARRLGVTSTEPALPEPLVESGSIRELGGEVFAHRVREGDAAASSMVKELGLPRAGLVNVIVRDGEAIPPRGSTVIRAGDELHVLVRQEARGQIGELIERWRTGPLGEPPLPRIAVRGSPQIFSVRPTTPADGDVSAPRAVAGVDVAQQLRVRRDRPGALVALVDGRFAVTGADVIALGGRRQLARWAVGRAQRPGTDPQERAWWQEMVGVLNAPALAGAPAQSAPAASTSRP